MPTIKTFGRVKITMYYGDHGVPHFHVIAPDFKVSVAIASLEILAGRAPPRRTREAIDWARQNRELLLAKWEDLHR
ncbi:MAG: hypothetical protein K0S35_2594 [Geminicoccaceae bacterium]|jgi:hypothetical protein|nr:hypothetical protein [Geminicoccaceae bacterium]